ncbi:sulfurtransferase complex subunit TusC [Aestuariirhabdus litorea]|uniref:Sulfurtransferase complex subunit TusC n=1 Tax=Aestuariirhabdus litorea TaxID=2528527 RepID=A0A3P3VPR9_9GAMM|nr:sulfurtransferase complex subunit TusC [Aestuariirhabdus litorea]RRJ84781.1 sulfurtransferase complex subunit TusC [Aestuariirhabdus litorea]RWW98005.1 sulfurtransferase complex subunit TusC [Endozoicomonadaceae bacterium GTF-13]
MARSLCILTSKAPYGGLAAKEALDAALIGAAFDLQVSILFDGDGVYQLLGQQNPAALGQKTFSAPLPALELYGIERLLASRDALESRGITREQLCIEVELLSSEALAQHLNDTDIVLGF